MSSKEGIATDVDHLVSLGFPVDVVRKTLELTKGDKEAAIKILGTGGIKKSDTNWRKESMNDWLDGISTTNLPKNDVNRALHKSPVYISVGSYHRKQHEVEYKLNVTLKNGKQWSIMRTYDQFSRFKGNLPLGTCLNFINGFPLPNVFHFLFSEESAEFLEKRRNLLGEWIRELTLNEDCMTSTKVLDALSFFIDLQANCGVGVTLLKLPTVESVNSSSNSLSFTVGDVEENTSPLLKALATNELEETRKLHLQSIPVLREDQFPLALGVMGNSLPFKVDIRKLECGREQLAARQVVKNKRMAALTETASPVDQSMYWDATHSTTSPASHNSHMGVTDIEIDEKQLRKDLSRDRIVVQGRKVVGSATELEAVVDICKLAILQTVVKAGHQLSAVRNDLNSGSPVPVCPPPPPPGNYTGPSRGVTPSNSVAAQETANHSLQMLDYVSKAALQQISRTESAFLSHSALMEMLDVNDTRRTENFAPFLVVPESTLAEPLVLNFHVQERNATSTGNERNNNSMYNISHHSTHVPMASAVSVDTANDMRAHHMETAMVVTTSTSPHASEDLRRQLASSPSISSLHEWCVVCEGEASTVYRVMDADTMNTILQIKVTFVYSLFALPVVQTTGRAERVVDFRLKEGKTYLLVSRDTTSTARDWKGPR